LSENWKFVPTAFIAYNGERLKYDNVSAERNGAQGGFMGTFNRGGFSGSMLAYFGGYFSKISISDFKDDINNWFLGTAFKGAYNFSYADNFIIQPNFLAAYNFFGKQNWNSNFAGMHMRSDAINAINIAPGVNFIYGGQSYNAYLTMSYALNMNDAIKGKAGKVNLDDIKTRRDYIEYGVGATKTWKGSLSSYIQLTLRGIGRVGASFKAGLSYRW
jgi:hypothetical protein